MLKGMIKKVKFEDKYDYLTAALWLLFFVQVVVLGYFNLTQLQYHMGFDASSYYLKAIEMEKQGTLFIENWVDQTTLYFDSPVPFAALIYSITGNIYFSYGLVDFIIDIAIFYFFFSILKSLKMSKTAQAVCLNMISCFYIAPSFDNLNDMSYFSSVLSSASWYSLKIMIILMVVKMILDVKAGKINWFYIIVTEILLFVSGVSSGWYLTVTVLLPLLVFYIIKVFVNNSLKEVIRLETLLVVVGNVLILIGKMVAVRALHYVSKDSSMILIGLEDFWKNLGSIVLGFMELVASFPYQSTQGALTLKGIIYLLGFCVFMVCLIGTIAVVRKVRKAFAQNEELAMLLCVVGFNILMFTVLFTKYGSEFFEIRYLIPLYILLTINVGAFIDMLDNRLIFKYTGILAVFGIMLSLKVYDDQLYYKMKNNYDTLLEVTEKIQEVESPVVYVYGSDNSIDARNLRVIDTDRVYKYVDENYLYNIPYHWGDYTYYDDVAAVRGKNVLISTNDSINMLPEYIKNQYSFYAQVDKYCIYTADTNKFDLVSGVADTENIDYPTTLGMQTANASIDPNGSLVSDGTEGYILGGPCVDADAGVYDFTLNYEVLSADAKTADFAITINGGQDEVAEIELPADERKVVLKDISFDRDVQGLEYKVMNYQGTIVRIDSIEITKKNTEEE